MKYTAAMIVLLAAPLVSAPPLKVLREIDLNSIIPVGSGFTPFATISFSPDEKWVAVAVGAHQMGRRKIDQNIDQGSESLLLIPLNGTGNETVQIHLGLRPVGSPEWSPDSAAVLVQGFAHDPRNSSTDGIVKLWDLRGDDLLRRAGRGLACALDFRLPRQ
ncbi:MAG TPA: hypothetical protein VHY84_28740 [Bryobacteraceae bacterium]|jgi:WD40 repeat protein|nr:hypothetical protein [Bryobacteraceae bacterium]